MKTKKNQLLSYLLNFACVIVLYVVLQVLISTRVINPYYAQIFTPLFINIILAVSLNLVCGYMGQLALGHAGFMAIGAYAGAVFTINCKSIGSLPGFVQLLLAMVIGGLIAGIVGALIGIPVLRLKGDYLAIMTLGFGEIIRVIFTNLKITGEGRSISAPELTSFPMVFWTAMVVIALTYAYVRSRHGRAVMSIREDEVAAEASGVNLTYYKVITFALAAAVAGVAGVLWSHSYSILPRNFDFNRSIEILIYVVLGGMGSITGSILAASVLTILPELLRGFNDYRMVIYALLLIIMMVFRPGGLLGRYEFSLIETPKAIARGIKKLFGRLKKAKKAKKAEKAEKAEKVKKAKKAKKTKKAEKTKKTKKTEKAEKGENA